MQGISYPINVPRGYFDLIVGFPWSVNPGLDNLWLRLIEIVFLGLEMFGGSMIVDLAVLVVYVNKVNEYIVERLWCRVFFHRPIGSLSCAFVRILCLTLGRPISQMSKLKIIRIVRLIIIGIWRVISFI